ncbi:MAG: CHRD domain-containing protein [Nitrososphaerota archaeon]
MTNHNRVISVILILLTIPLVGLGTFLAYSEAHAQKGGSIFVATLSGFNEVPSVASNGFGFAIVTISEDEKSITFELTYYDLANVSMAHIHFGRDGHVGGVAVWLCGGPKPACPTSYGKVTGTRTASDVVALPAQGLNAGDFDQLIKAIRAGAAYVNVHTAKFPAGEIRGQLVPITG